MEHHAGEDLRHHDRAKSSEGGVETDENGGDTDREPERPSQKTLEHRRRAHENGRDRGQHEERPDDGEERAHGRVVAPAQVLRDGGDVRAPEERHEEERGEEDRKDASHEIEIHHDDSVAIAVARETYHVLRADVGDDERHSRRPPGNGLPREEIIAAGSDSPARPEPEPGDGQKVEDDEPEIEGRELHRFHSGGNLTSIRERMLSLARRFLPRHPRSADLPRPARRPPSKTEPSWSATERSPPWAPRAGRGPRDCGANRRERAFSHLWVLEQPRSLHGGGGRERERSRGGSARGPPAGDAHAVGLHDRRRYRLVPREHASRFESASGRGRSRDPRS